jgi:predicted enzyme related to lactoylglutathione lyase
MEIKLLVLRTPDPPKLAHFYSQLGMQFEYHQHGNSHYHYSTLIGKTVLEIYPLAKNQIQADSNLRLGFEIDDFYNVLEQFTQQNVKIVHEPMQTEFGTVAVIQDPDGRKIELYKKED